MESRIPGADTRHVAWVPEGVRPPVRVRPPRWGLRALRNAHPAGLLATSITLVVAVGAASYAGFSPGSGSPRGPGAAAQVSIAGGGVSGTAEPPPSPRPTPSPSSQQAFLSPANPKPFPPPVQRFSPAPKPSATPAPTGKLYAADGV